MRLAAAFVMAILCIACSEQREEDTAACHLEALKTYPNEYDSYSALIDHFMATCMEAKGYKLNLHPDNCGGDLYENPACYK
jgi:recombinational DNA repair protein (RecF pathway)